MPYSRFRPLSLICVLARTGSQATAQPPEEEHALFASLLELNEVRSELELTNDQTAALKKASQEYRRSNPKGPLKFDSPQQVEKFRERVRKTTEAYGAKIKESLTEEQLRRLRELSVQRLGAISLIRDDVAGKLQLSAEQRGKIKGIHDRRVGSLVPGKESSAAFREKVKLAFQTADAEILAILTPEQSEAFEAMKGEKFEFP